MSLGLAVLALATQAYFAAHKAKALAVAGSMLKVAGTQAVNEIYKNLHQSRHLFGRGATADGYLSRLPLPPYFTGPGHLNPGLELDELRLPDIRLKGSFWLKDANDQANPDFDPDAVGNALMFCTTEQKAGVNDPPGEDIQKRVFGSSLVQFGTTRLHLYFLAHRPLPRGQAVRRGDAWVYQLMHFRSHPYLDAREVTDWLRQLHPPGGGGATPFVRERLAELAELYPGAIALDADDASRAFFQLAAEDDGLGLRLEPDNRIEDDEYRTPLAFAMAADFGIPMVAFNTADPASPPPGASPAPAGVKVAKLEVPSFARPGTPTPYGFELMIGGPPDRRQVLVRLALAAKAQPGNVMIGAAYQQVVQVADF